MFVSVVKFQNGEINYLNSDATWHTLLTVRAYSETPISVHKFLPIVSLGNPEDKNIPWGACVPDKFGNYYYTSFSPATYILPFLFFKLFRLSVSESSLYLFNSLLFALSAALWICFLQKLFAKNENAFFISMVGALVYIFSPELFHGMGIVYWAQSLFQVSFVLQLLAYYAYRFENKKNAKIGFYLRCRLNPYIEWTGYVANVGFAIAEFALLFTTDKKSAFREVFVIGFLTILSFALFCSHYLLNVDAKIFFKTVKSRFFARNITTSTPIASVIGGYVDSFKWIWLYILLFSSFLIVKTGKIVFQKRIFLFLTLFPILENVIMKQHAVSYTYDRMKLAFFLSLFACILTVNVLDSCKNLRIAQTTAISILALLCILNLNSYIHSQKYIWQTDYRTANQEFATYINENYSDSVLGLEGYSVRGYANMLFGRGIYEWRNRDTLIEIAASTGKKYAVILKAQAVRGICTSSLLLKLLT